ncbi:acyl-CoA dehydrogenase family protein [Rhizobium sp.]|uniref:acyl-CoA dehydrogenase family protein n=1 Tax=Rhizobium sp. TaxID=391 RepID=UPI0028A5F4D9
MSKVVNLAGTLRAVSPYIRTEDEAIEVAKALANEIRTGFNRHDRQSILSHHTPERVAQSGILGISVPTEYGGADISNPFLAEVVALLSEVDSSIGQIPQNHFHILEVLRLAGSEEQKRSFFAKALAGDHFANAFAEKNIEAAGAITTRLVPDGVGYRISGQKYYSTSALFADWIAIIAQDPEDRTVMAIVPRQTEGLDIVDDRAGCTVIIDNIYVSADSIIAHDRALQQSSTLGSLGRLLHAAVDLGVARAAFADMLDFVGTRSRGNPSIDAESTYADPLAIAKTGSVAIKIEAAAALVERAGRKVDVAQVSPSVPAASDASVAVAAAKILTAEAALEAANTLFELVGTSATDETLDLDRHWHNAGNHPVDDPVHWYHAVGDFHLNGKIPDTNLQF